MSTIAISSVIVQSYKFSPPISTSTRRSLYSVLPVLGFVDVHTIWPHTESKPLNRSTKIGIPETPTCSKFGANLSTGCGQIGEISLFWLYLFIYLFILYRQLTYMSSLQRILRRDKSKDAFSRTDVPFGVIKVEINIEPIFMPKDQILAKMDFVIVPP